MFYLLNFLFDSRYASISYKRETILLAGLDKMAVKGKGLVTIGLIHGDKAGAVYYSPVLVFVLPEKL